MARAKITGFEDLERMLKKLEQPEKMAIKAVDAAAPIVERNLKTEVRRAANRKDGRGRSYATGELEKSIQTTKAKENNIGVFAVVRPVGNDSRGLRNVEKMAYLEYGVAAHGQMPRPVRQKTVSQSEEDCIRTMQEVIDAEVEKM